MWPEKCVNRRITLGLPQQPEACMQFGKKLSDHFKEYEEGKHRRYNLLFAVNGGAFAIVKFAFDPKIVDEARVSAILGGLSLVQISVGMILFTIVMSIDIFLFGINLRSTLPAGNSGPSADTVEIFGTPGKCVLILITALLCLGWALAALGEPCVRVR